MKYFEDEKSFCKVLEDVFFPTFFDQSWKPIHGKTKEVYIRQKSLKFNKKPEDRIDYFGYKNQKPTYIEVKNNRITQQNLIQIVGYFCHATQECQATQKKVDFNFFVICTEKNRPYREKILEKLDIVLLTPEDIFQN